MSCPPTDSKSTFTNQLSAFLPQALRTALHSYQDYAARDVPNEDKAFATRHTDLKAAIAHIELLVKLAKQADLPEDVTKAQPDQDLSALIKAASQELKSYKTKA